MSSLMGGNSFPFQSSFSRTRSIERCELIFNESSKGSLAVETEKFPPPTRHLDVNMSRNLLCRASAREGSGLAGLSSCCCYEG